MAYIKLATQLYRLAVLGEDVGEEVRKELKLEQMTEIYNISKAHDLAHLIGDVLVRAKLQDESFVKSFLSAKSTALYRYVHLSYELEQITALFNAMQIPYIPLKGSILRQYYPQEWMRTSCDIDILVHESDLARAGESLKQDLGYTFRERGVHDVSYYSPSGVHLELHYDLTEANERFYKFAKNVWDMSTKKSTDSYAYETSNEFFIVYHIAHMAGHLLYGGCGIRSFLDLWIIKNKMRYDKAEVLRLLSLCELTRFAEIAFQLTDVWFENAEHTQLTRELEEYIIGGGIYGTLENKVSMQQTRNKGKIRYVISRIFLPYKKMTRLYPRLNKAPILLPFYHVKRWISFLFKKDKKRAFAELKYNASLSNEKKEQTRNMLEQLELLK